MRHNSLFNTAECASRTYLDYYLNKPSRVEWLERLWQSYAAYATPSFKQEFQNNNDKFYSLSWEMIAANDLLNQGFELVPQKSDNAPDICIALDGKKAWVECTLPTRGDVKVNPNALPSIVLGEAYHISMDKNYLRCITRLQEKREQHRKWVSNGICASDEPFIIALNGTLLDAVYVYERAVSEICGCVYPIGSMVIDVSIESRSILASRIEAQEKIETGGLNPVSKCLFLDESSSLITGLLYTSHWLPAPQNARAYAYVENLMAKNKFPLDLGDMCVVHRANIDNNSQLSIAALTA